MGNKEIEINDIFKSLIDVLDKNWKENGKLAESKKSQLIFTSLNGKYYVGDKELPSDLREWGETMVSEMAKKLLE
jgi:hypothetical protein